MVLILGDSPFDFAPRFRNVPFEEKSIVMTAYLREIALARAVILVDGDRCRWLKAPATQSVDKVYSLSALPALVRLADIRQDFRIVTFDGRTHLVSEFGKQTKCQEYIPNLAVYDDAQGPLCARCFSVDKTISELTVRLE